MALAQLKIQEEGDVEQMLAKLPIELRQKVMQKALREAAKPVVAAAKSLCPKPGYKGDKKGPKALRDTIAAEIREYGQRSVIIVGPAYPAGAHGHLVEFGHRIARGGKLNRLSGDSPALDDLGRPKKRRTRKTTKATGVVAGKVAARPFLRPAADGTIAAQKAAFERVFAEAIEALVKP